MELILTDREIYYDDYPLLSIEIDSTDELHGMVDKLRMAKGYMPFFYEGDGIEYWDNGWYDFYVIFDLKKDLVVGLEAYVVGNNNWDEETVPDNETTYQLNFDPDDLTMQIGKLLNIEELREEAKEYYGEICD